MTFWSLNRGRAEEKSPAFLFLFPYFILSVLYFAYFFVYFLFYPDVIYFIFLVPSYFSHGINVTGV